MNISRILTVAFVCSVALAMAPAVAQHSKDSMSSLTHPRYKENPIYLFFEDYILDVIGHLPQGKSKSIQDMNLQKVFKSKSSEWHQVLQETLHLSGTIDIAIRDLWHRNQEIGKKQGIVYDPRQFAMDFTDEYMKEGSKVDVWPPGALEAAKKRIAEAKTKYGN